MCLDTLDKEIKEIKNPVKLFFVSKRTGLEGICQDFTYKEGVWIKDTNESFISMPHFQIYKAGFHFYYNEDIDKSKQKYSNFHFGVIRKIKVRNIVATGTVKNKKVGVAKEIFIIPDREILFRNFQGVI